MSFNLTQTVTVALDGSGNGRGILQAVRGDWVVLYTTVSVSTQTLQPQFFVYRGSAHLANVIDSTYSGGKDTSDTRYVLKQGETIIVEWLGGDPAATATATFSIVQYDADKAPLE